jgi:hypothetical protein
MQPGGAAGNARSGAGLRAAFQRLWRLIVVGVAQTRGLFQWRRRQ